MGGCGSKDQPSVIVEPGDVAVEKARPTAVQFNLLGRGLVSEGQSVAQTSEGHAFALASPTLRCGAASATFGLEFTKETADVYKYCVGVFPADLQLDSRIHSADGKRVSLWLGSSNGGYASVRCDGVSSPLIKDLGWASGDTVEVGVTFTGDAARVTFGFKGRTEERTLPRDDAPVEEEKELEGLPACGLCFGAGLGYEGTSVELVTSLLDAEVVAAALRLAGSASPCACLERRRAAMLGQAPVAIGAAHRHPAGVPCHSSSSPTEVDPRIGHCPGCGVSSDAPRPPGLPVTPAARRQYLRRRALWNRQRSARGAAFARRPQPRPSAHAAGTTRQ